jgi:hypothetical protein
VATACFALLRRTSAVFWSEKASLRVRGRGLGYGTRCLVVWRRKGRSVLDPGGGPRSGYRHAVLSREQALTTTRRGGMRSEFAGLGACSA